jgi:hypothetical protein
VIEAQRLFFAPGSGAADDLCTGICLPGADVLLVNLDSACQTEAFEAIGAYLDEGDLLIIAGRYNSSAGQSWAINGTYDTTVISVYSTSVAATSLNGINERLFIVVGIGAGQTSLNLVFTWGSEVVRSVCLSIFVDFQPALVASRLVFNNQLSQLESKIEEGQE